MRIVVIPGLGGHPAFHAALIERLSEKFEVRTAPYGDFSAEPFETIADHCAYWRPIVEAAGDDVAIVGISFGAYLALALPPKLLARARAVILVSWWPLGRVERAIVAILDVLPKRIARRLVGHFLFSASDAMMDQKNLANLRRRLYDTLPAVQSRLLGRLLCLRSKAHSAPSLTTRLFMIYGLRDLAFFRCRLSRPKLWVNSNQLVIVGGHDISLKESALAGLITNTLKEVEKGLYE